MIRFFSLHTYKTIAVLFMLLTASAVSAQEISSDDITESLDFVNGNVAYSLKTDNIPDGSTLTWTINGKDFTDGVSDDGRTVTIPLSSTVRKAKVTITCPGSDAKYLEFDIEPKNYGEDYNGKHFYADSFDNGSGTKDDPYIIKNDMQLALLAHNVTNGNAEQMFSGKYFKLSDNINLNKGFWMPIGTWSTKTKHFFAGKFDGDGHTISNMHISWTASDENSVEASWGLFSRLYGKSSNEDGYAVVTNLVIDNAKVEKKTGYQPVGNGTVKIGVLAGDLTDNAEISNVIIQNSEVTDNDETYSTAGKYRTGGIVGYLDGKRYKIYNIAADTEMRMLKNTRINNDVTISAGIGCASNFRTDNAILPTNIYVYGQLVTSRSNRVRRGGVVAFYNSSYKFNAEQQKTLYYSPQLKQEGSNTDNYGTEKDIESFGQEFATQCNNFISDKSLDRKMWSFFSSTNRLTFNTTMLKVERGNTDVLKVVDTDGVAFTEKYYWYVSYDNITWKKLNSDPSSEYTLPRKDYNQYVYAMLADGSSRTNIEMVKAIVVTADLRTTTGAYTINVDNNTDVSNDGLGLNITYEWYNGETKLEGTGNTFKRPDSAGEDDKYSCHVTVYSGALLLLNKWFNTQTVVYLNPADADSYTEEQRIEDENYGYSPKKPMTTWRGAYSKLSKNASWSDNYIVLIGESSFEVTNDPKTGFSVTKNYQGEGTDQNMSYEDWKNVVDNSPLCRNVTITGKWKETDYEGVIMVNGAFPIWGDTRFQNVTFKGITNTYSIIYCQYHNLEMGKSIRMTGYDRLLPGYSTIDGAVTNAFHIFGGLNNDARFPNLDTEEKIKNFEESLPHGRDGFKIKIISGFYSCICTGGRQIGNNSNIIKQNGAMGTPNLPIKCTIDVDIDREWNKEYNEKRKLLTGETRENDYDIGIVLAGNHEGAMYADVDIVIKSGRIGRVVNGTLGNQHNAKLRYNGKEYPIPDNSFMGRANILIDPASSVNNTIETGDDRVIITELYGGSTGRGQEYGITVNNPFYGYSTITIKGGTFKILPDGNEKKNLIFCGIYGAGAGGMNGIGYGNDTDETHTPDLSIPYWNTEKTVMLYGPYAEAKDNLIKYHCYNANDNTYTDVDPTETNTKIVINGGKFGSSTETIDGIYAGGSGYMSSGLWTKNNGDNLPKPSIYGGNIYGNKEGNATSLTIYGGEFYCKNGIFAGGRGTYYYYQQNPYGGTDSDYTDLGKTYGNVELDIHGGTFHCPVYGGGYGVADAKLKSTQQISTLSNMAKIYGKSTVNIFDGTFYKNIYGGGDMAQIEYNGDNNATTLNIYDKADIRGSVFAGGNGKKKRLETVTNINDDTQSPELVGRIIGNTNVSFYGSTEMAPYIYGDIYGGGNLAQVEGNTNVNIYAANFAGQVFGGGKGRIYDESGNPLTKDLYTSADITGNTSVTLSEDQRSNDIGKEDDKYSINVVWNKMWQSDNTFYTWNSSVKGNEGETLIPDSTQFFDEGKYINPHNIYGGGNLACNVSGTAYVTVLKGMTPFSLLQTQEWKESYTDNDNPHFSVFGGGYGANTSVGYTDVFVDVEGDYGIYDAETDDNTDQLAKDHNTDLFEDDSTPAAKKKARRNARKKAIAKSEPTMPVFDNSKGIPNFTILGVMGGGYSGIVNGDTKVTVDGQTFLHRIYGGGFGDPESTENNTTGQVKGNTEVFVQGAKTYGDVFGGGAGVAPKTVDGIHFTDVARVLGTTMVKVSDDANVYGKVFGGGDMANVGEKTTQDYSVAASSVSTLDQSNNGAVLGYEAKDYRSFVNIIGGNVYGEVFGGGKGLTKAKATEYYNVGRINGNTLVHITDSKPGAGFDDADNIKPYVWNRIYGGCAYGTVDGNTLVHIEGGMLGLNIFGGGYGDVPIIKDDTQDDQNTGASTSMTILNQVLGKKDLAGNGTYANILGNTKVQIDGGSWIWNQIADINGNKLKWTASDADNAKVCDDYIDFRKIAFAMQDSSTADIATLMKLQNIMQKISTDKSTKEFFDFNTLSFKKNHNIFGGGNRACYVGTYTNSSADNMLSETPATGTGEAEVVINHSPLTDIPDSKGNLVNLLDNTTLQGFCWVLANSNTAHPQFSVFGAGYGANTKVGNAKVYVQPGARSNNDGSDAIEIDGKKIRYVNQHADGERYRSLINRFAEDFTKISNDDKRRYYGSSDGTDNDGKTYQRYRTTRMAWELGVPNSTFFEIHGGGFSGYVVGDTYVETDCQLTCRNIYGAGLGHVPYGDIIDDTKYDFGSIGGKSKVFIKSGYVARNVYGGGAGVESVRVNGRSIVGLNDSGNIVDFPDMARVNKKSEVNIYGEDIISGNNIIDRTQIYGSVYGGGDVANVGTEEMKAEAKEIGHEAYSTPQNYTSLVNIRGGAIFSQIFAGGNGRKESQCAHYTKLGGIYGNTCIVIDRPAAGMTYPYYNEDTKEWKNPSDGNMMHPGTGVNENIIPYIFNRVYGGCENGTVYGNTILAINDGYIGHNIFGGGWGNCDTLTVNGTEVVKKTSADVTGNTNMVIVGGKALLTSYWNADKRFWEPSTIIGDKTYSPQYDPTTRKFYINHNIYGGGNEACVVGEDSVENSGNTYLTMVKGLLYDDTQVLSGQSDDKKFFERDEWKEVYEKVGSPHFGIFGGGYGENTTILGDTHVNVQMHGSSSSKKDDLTVGEEYKHFLSGYSVMDIVGGGYSGKVNGNTHITGAGGVYCRRMFGGGFYNTVNATEVEVKAVDCHDIFGGGLMGDVYTSTTINIGHDASSGSSSNTETFSNSNIYIHGDVYGGNDVSGYVNVTLDNAGYFADNGGTGTHINIYGGRIDGNVYGAGNGDYLYSLDRKGHTQVTVNEHYPLNPNDPNSETEPLVYTVPMRETMPSYKAASDAAKIVNINSWRPLTNKVSINIKGNSKDDYVNIKGDVYGGGNSATVQKVQKVKPQIISDDDTDGFINFNIGSNVNIGRVFMGCNGDALFSASEDNNFMNKFQKLNGDIDDFTKELNLGDTIDWKNDPSNKGISTLYLSTKNDDRPTVYPHLLDLYFQPVETDIQASLKWNGSENGDGLTNCTIGTFCCGGNRGNMNVYPNGNGNAFEYTFPEGLTITGQIVGGCNNANYDLKGKVEHEGGYLLGLAHSKEPFIKLNVKCKFQPNEKNGAYYGGNVFGGCYKTGTVRGDITINLVSDMLEGKCQEKLEKSNELLSSDPTYAALNVYGAGYGMESYVYGNTHIKVAEGLECKKPQTTEQTSSSDGGSTTATQNVFNASGTSANFIYGGGQQGNVIGITNVEVFNGHVFKAVTGGSYSGYVWGSTQVKVGYPKYYKVHSDHYVSGRYILNRADQNNKYIDRVGKTEDGALRTDLASETIKQSINLITDDIISQAVYEDIVAKYDSLTNTNVDITGNKSYYFQEIPAETPSVGWDKIYIQIGEAVYGGGYSVGQGTSVLANATTVLKFTPKYNIDNAFNTNDQHIEELKNLPGGTTAGFGGNTTVLVGDLTDSSSTRDHITISHQQMKKIVLPNGTDLYGYYYMDKENNYRYISLQDTYKYGEKYPKEQNVDDKNIYEYDSEGGIFGDGHQSYAQGFRSADLTGYGFASYKVSTAKILNTFQRLDILRLEDNCFSVLGARDYATNATNKTPYSIARVGEIQMHAVNVQVDSDGKLKGNSSLRARNYMGLANNIHYVGAITSNVVFEKDEWRDGTGALASSGNKFSGKSYQEVKQAYIDDYYKGTDGNKGIVSLFQKRNDGTAKNMIGIASGYALKIHGVQETYDSNHKVEDNIYYGPIYGVIEMNLIDARPDEGGGYVYADNVHKRSTDENGNKHDVDFLETTGNFVYPYTAQEGHFIVDDCFPTGYEDLKDKDNPDEAEDVHYWYVTGFNYYYNVHITAYTYKDNMKFNSDNSDGLTVLSGLKGGQPVEVFSWKMRSGHPEDETEYSCDLENRNYLPKDTEGNVDMDGNYVSGKYKLYVGAAASNEFSDPDKEEKKADKGFAALLPMKGEFDAVNDMKKNTLPTGLKDDAKITFQLQDCVNNTTSDYFNKHLSKKCLATLILTAPAYKSYTSEEKNVPVISKIAAAMFYTKNENGGYDEVPAHSTLNAGTDYYIKNGFIEDYTLVNPDSIFVRDDTSDDGYKNISITDVKVDEPIYYCAVPRHYTYTVYLTIEYVQGPTIDGNITIENCALPGEMIRIKKNEVSIKGDQSFSANGYYWRIGRCKKDDKGTLSFVDDTEWKVGATAEGYDTYKQGDKNGTGVFTGCFYDKTEDYLEIPAYYYMMGYGVQLGITMNGIDKIFPVEMQAADTLLVHNYHKMYPGQTGVNLHLAEAVARAKAEKDFAEPRIYISDKNDISSFINYVDTVGTGKDGGYVVDGKEYVKMGVRKDGEIWKPLLYEVPRNGANTQFVIQNNLDISTFDYDGSSHTDFAGKVHGNGHVISGLKAGRCLFNSISGNIYNLGLVSGKISNMQTSDGKIPNYHCCFEYAPMPNKSSTPVVYRMDGTAVTTYSNGDFKNGKVAYDLNEYYLRARYSNDKNNKEDMATLKYIYDYYANGDYQYAHRSDSITGRVTGITFLRTGKDSDLPNYGQAETRHNQAHTIDKARIVYSASTSDGSQSDGTSTPSTSASFVYEPLFNDNHEKGATFKMNDFLFWGQLLQSTPAEYPSTIGYQQYTDNVWAHRIDYMTNRVYRTAGYYGDTKLDAFHYNAYNYNGSSMDTYIHDAKTTAIDFTCQNDLQKALGMTDATATANAVYYPPVDDNATVFHGLTMKDGVSQNLLVYTAANNENVDTEAYDIADKSLAYDGSTKEAVIKGHHIYNNGNGFSTPLLHLVERTPDNMNSEEETCNNNDFCAPIAFSVTNRAWYTRKPQYYAEKNTGAWEGVCLPFTVDKAEAYINGEITHFYGTPTAEEIDDPAKNIHDLHHEYWLRGFMSTTQDSNGKTLATFQRPGAAGSTADGKTIAEGGTPLFAPVDKDGNSLCESVSYGFDNPFFINTYEDRLYNKTANPYYGDAHTYEGYQLQVANVPYIVRFPGEQYYEFDLSSKFYNNITGKKATEQTVTFNAYGPQNVNSAHYGNGSVNIPVTSAENTSTAVGSYSHRGCYAATQVATGSVYGMNADGTAFEDASTLSTVMPFRTYMTVAASGAKTRSAIPSVINIAEPTGIDKISPDMDNNGEDADEENSLIVRPIGNHRVCIESTQAMLLDVYTAAGQLFRKLDIQPGTATYSGFPSGMYLFGKTKVAVE